MKKQIEILDLQNNLPPQKADYNNENIDEIVTNAPDGSLILFPAEVSGNKIVIMCPGGGFNKVNLKHEGYEFADWFNASGISYAILKYRIPNGNDQAPLQDMQQALHLVRKLPKIKRIGVMGASIGGYIAANAAIMLPSGIKPDFQILLYSVINMEDDLTHRPSRLRMFGKELSTEEGRYYSLEYHISDDTPPTFITAAADDNVVNPLNSCRLCEQLIKTRVPVAFHLYPKGGHSFGFNNEFPFKTEWLNELRYWLESV